MSQRPLSAIVLAAGKGTRMKSALPKVLHPVAGMPMITYPLSALKSTDVEDVRVIVGHGKEMVQNVVHSLGFSCFEQKDQKGTADAVKSADPATMQGDVFIVNGDHPLLTAEDFKGLVKKFREDNADIAVMSAELANPGSYGRIVRQSGEIRAIVEAKDAGHETLAIKEINSGIYLVKSEVLNELLPKISNDNQQSEYYLTDIISLGIENGFTVKAYLSDSRVAFGVNDQKALATATQSLMRGKVQQLMENGVVIIDPKNTYIEPTVSVGAGTVIHPGVYLRSRSVVGNFCVIEMGVQMENSIVGNSVMLKAYSVLEESKVESNSQIGPFARLRPQSEIGEDCKVGNFVELKKTKMGKGSKASHLTYLGDAELGSNVNIGCGTITCNYAVDKKKYKTEIGDDVFVGSDSQFIAPVKVGNKAVIGSGSVITKDVPEKALAVTRAKQVIKENYVKDSE
jgi:bifunctional UDP-N-acetylglucosamine pyrophosphorylase/glucosamine-1-phosphate N-acetyltransferase